MCCGRPSEWLEIIIPADGEENNRSWLLPYKSFSNIAGIYVKKAIVRIIANGNVLAFVGISTLQWRRA